MADAKRVKDIMTSEIETVSPDDTLKRAAVKMEALDVGPLPVCDGERLVGILTDRDITVRAVASGRDPNRTTVREAMTAEPLYCFEDQSLDEVAALMRERQVRRFPVLNREKRLVGIVALADLVRRGDEAAGKEAFAGISRPTEQAPTERDH
jgi:CBS domain-containing protein